VQHGWRLRRYADGRPAITTTPTCLRATRLVSITTVLPDNILSYHRAAWWRHLQYCTVRYRAVRISTHLLGRCDKVRRTTPFCAPRFAPPPPPPPPPPPQRACLLRACHAASYARACADMAPPRYPDLPLPPHRWLTSRVPRLPPALVGCHSTTGACWVAAVRLPMGHWADIHTHASTSVLCCNTKGAWFAPPPHTYTFTTHCPANQEEDIAATKSIYTPLYYSACTTKTWRAWYIVTHDTVRR